MKTLSFAKNEQKEPWFLAINPNGRIPALSDTYKDGKPINIFESGAIMQYLASRYDTAHKLSYPAGSREDIEVNAWLFFLNAGVGPMQGQSNHFTRYAPETIEYGINRYQNETRRLYGVLDKQLQKSSSGWLVGDRCTIADIAHYGWVAASAWAGVQLDEFPALKAWEEKCTLRPAFEKGRHVPSPHNIREASRDPAKLAKMIEDNKEKSAWILKGMKDDAKK